MTAKRRAFVEGVEARIKDFFKCLGKIKVQVRVSKEGMWHTI